MPLSKLNRRHLSLEMHLQPWQSHISVSGILRKKKWSSSSKKKILCRSQAGQFKCLRWKTDVPAFSGYLNWPGYLPGWIWPLVLRLLLKHLALGMWAFKVMLELNFFFMTFGSFGNKDWDLLKGGTNGKMRSLIVEAGTVTNWLEMWIQRNWCTLSF